MGPKDDVASTLKYQKISKHFRTNKNIGNAKERNLKIWSSIRGTGGPPHRPFPQILLIPRPIELQIS